MSYQLKKAFENQEVLSKLKNADSPQEVESILTSSGVNITAEEIEEALEYAFANKEKTDEVSEEDLENVSGGFAFSGAIVALRYLLTTLGDALSDWNTWKNMSRRSRI